MDAIRSYMARRRLTQTAFAKEVGVTQGMVWQWLSGYRPISPESAIKIEEATGGAIKKRSLRPDIFGKRDA